MPAFLSRVDWIDVLPVRWRGLMIANEVLDAVPPNELWIVKIVTATETDGGETG